MKKLEIYWFDVYRQNQKLYRFNIEVNESDIFISTCLYQGSLSQSPKKWEFPIVKNINASQLSTNQVKHGL